MAVAGKRGDIDECIKHNARLIRIDEDLARNIDKFVLPIYVKAHPELKNHTFSWTDKIAILYEYYITPPKSLLQKIDESLERDAA